MRCLRITNADKLKELRPMDALVMIKAVGLRKKHEELLIMRYVNDMSCTEIADIKHVDVGTARNMVCKARKMFNKYTDGL